MSPSVIGAVAVTIIVVALIDLVRRDVRHVPKWAWALVITFFIFPIGVLLYFILECTPIGDQSESGTDP